MPVLPRPPAFTRGFRWLLPLALAAVVLAGCAEAENPQPQAQFPDEGLQATGQIGGKRVAVSSGNPDVTFGDCDLEDGPDDDLCFSARTIDGEELAVVLENPAVLAGVTDGEVPVRPDGCESAACDDVAQHAVVDVRLGQDRSRALSGSLTPTVVTPGQMAARFRLTLAGGGRLVGSFNVAR